MTLTTDTIPPRVLEMAALLREISNAKTPQEASFIYGKAERQFFPTDGFLSLSTRGLQPGQFKLTRQYIDGNFPENATDNPWEQWDSFDTHSAGFLAECLATGLPQIINDLNVTNDPVLGDRIQHFRSCLVLPVWEAGEPLNWAIVFKHEQDGFTESDLQSRLLTFNMHGRSTTNLIALTQVRELNARLNIQLERVAMIQRALLPDRTPDIPGVEIATSFLPSDEAGGDFFDFLELTDGKWGVFLADVSGHGAGAATVAAMLYTILHAYPGDHSDPGAVLTYCNQHLSRKRIDSSFATAIYAVLDPKRRTLCLANAGHLPPRCKNCDSGDVHTIEGPSGIPLGIQDGVVYESFMHQLSPYNTVIFYTDGITEARSKNGDFFTHNRLDASLRECSGEPFCVIDSIHTSLYDFTNKRTREDDQTIITLQLTLEDDPS